MDKNPTSNNNQSSVIAPRKSEADVSRILSWMPGLYTLLHYRKEWLKHDIIAGLVLTTVLIPVGIAYAVAAGIPGIYGLYASIVPILAYAIFGPSRFIVVGPDSALAGIIFAIITPLAAGDPERLLALAGMLAITSGLICILAGIARLGFITELLSKPIRYGFVNGIALVVLISQLPALLGISIGKETIFEQVSDIAKAIFTGNIHWPSTSIGLGALVIILLLKKSKRLPAALIALLVSMPVAYFFKQANMEVEVLGSLPQGLPSFSIPFIQSDDFIPLLLGGAIIALISFSETSILSRAYAIKTNSYVNPNKEVIGLGAANLAAGFFQGFPVSSSASRTPVAESAGAKTLLSSVVGAIMICLLLVFAPDLLSLLPNAALAAVVIASMLGMFEITDLKRIYKIQRWEFWLSMICFAGVAIFGILPGIGIAIGIAILEFLWDGWRPHFAILGRVDQLKGYHDISRHPSARLIPGLVLFRWDAPLFFANAELFHQSVLDIISKTPYPVNRLVVTSEPVTSIDITSADMLVELDDQLKEAGIELCFAEMKDPVKDKIKRFGLSGRFGNERFFPTVGQAVSQYISAFNIEWIDWENRKNNHNP
ncbi:MAG: sulfate permease [Alcaligenaceae bacterium]|nr:sulfate permease [Alcaligenaceae bacterium]